MIIKGSSRAGPRQLARHLQRTDTNERVEILELQSLPQKLTEVFRDWQCISESTLGKKGLYHANIDPDARYAMTHAQWMHAADVLEAELALTGQPRAIVLHEKEGREHLHVVWQRTNIDTMTLVSDSHNYYAHERASLALETEFGHAHVAGKHAKRDRSRPPPATDFTDAEWHQAERTGTDPRERKEQITALFQQCDTGQAFRAALGDAGYMLAKGDRRDFVTVDVDGEVHSLARQIKGVTAKVLCDFMGDVEPDSIPSVEQAKALRRDQSANYGPLPGSDTGDSGQSQEPTENVEQTSHARHEAEFRRVAERQEAEQKRAREILDREIAEKLEAFDAVHDAARDRWERQHNPPKRGMDALIAWVKSTLYPDESVREAWRKEQARHDFFQHLQAERETWLARQRAEQDKTLQELTALHAQKRREHEAKYVQDWERRVKGPGGASNGMDEVRRQDMEHQQPRDGPQPTLKAGIKGSRFLQPQPSHQQHPQVAAPTRFSRFIATTAEGVAVRVRATRAAFVELARILTARKPVPRPEKPEYTGIKAQFWRSARRNDQNRPTTDALAEKIKGNDFDPTV